MREAAVIGDDLKQEIANFHEQTYRQRKKLRMRDYFWGAVDDMDLTAAMATNEQELLQAVTRNHKKIGAPGDFGYGTPVGDSLAKIYKLAFELSQALNPLPAPQPA